MDLTIRLPRLFAEDHMMRECATGELISENGRYMTFRITDQATFNDWSSDADYYSDATGFDFSNMHSMCRSARSCQKILLAAKT